MSKNYVGKGKISERIYVTYLLSDDFVLPEENSEEEKELYRKLNQAMDNIDSDYECDTEPFFYEEDGKKYLDFEVVLFVEVSLSGTEYEGSYEEPDEFDSVITRSDGLIEKPEDFTDDWKNEFKTFFANVLPIQDVNMTNVSIDETLSCEEWEREEPDYDYYDCI